MTSLHPRLTGFARTFSLLGLIGIGSLSTGKAAPLPSSFGVWDRGEAMDPKVYPFVRGTSCDAPWDEVEKKPGVYDWSVMDQAIARAYRDKISLYFSFEAGPKTPDWVYAKGVPKVVTDDKLHADKFPHYPYYLAPEYKTYYHRFLTAVAQHIRSYPRDRQERIAFIQVKTGCTGDECAYKGAPVDKQYDLPVKDPAWKRFRLETFALYAKLFCQDPGPKFSLLLNGVAPESEGSRKDYGEEWKWATTTLKEGFGIKNGALSRGHHLSGERTAMSDFLPYLVDPKGFTLFRRSEMDQTWTRPWYQLNVPLNFYWGAINALNSGQSVWDVTKVAIAVSKEQGFDYSFYFFNKYAGQIYPWTATDAFCALHKGLDAADTAAYPEARFGPASKGNVDRMLKICAAYAKYGAAVDDKNALTMGQVQQRGDQAGFNDVGWDIWPDNYSRLLDQIEPDETSIPRWRVGGPITPTSPIYARFARGFEHASGKDALYFKLRDGFSQDAQPKVMSITVVWYDGQEGSTWKLDYDAGAPTMKTALSVTGKGDKKWHHEAVTLPDAVFRQGGIKGADLALVNTDAQDDIFSLIEVHRGEAELPALRPPTEVRAFPGYAKGTKYQKSEPAETGEKVRKGKRNKAETGEKKE
jgi:hypothetical protein